MRLAASYLIGLLFGLGIALSGMINPAKVINFFDFLGSWDPSLALVMGGALTVAATGYAVVLRRPAPFLAESFRIPARRDIDLSLLGGAAIFGVGWGIAGFCPGGALPALGTGKSEVILFVASMIAGIAAVKAVRAAVRRQPREAVKETA